MFVFLVLFQSLKNLGEVLKVAGATYKNGRLMKKDKKKHRHHYIDIFVLVVKANVFLQDMNDFAAMNEVYSECKYISYFLL